MRPFQHQAGRDTNKSGEGQRLFRHAALQGEFRSYTPRPTFVGVLDRGTLFRPVVHLSSESCHPIGQGGLVAIHIRTPLQFVLNVLSGFPIALQRLGQKTTTSTKTRSGSL